MVAELVNDRADLTLFPLTLTQPRTAVIDFTYSYVDGGIGLLVRAARPTATALGFLRPFSWEASPKLVSPFAACSGSVGNARTIYKAGCGQRRSCLLWSARVKSLCRFGSAFCLPSSWSSSLCTFLRACHRLATMISRPSALHLHGQVYLWSTQLIQVTLGMGFPLAH